MKRTILFLSLAVSFVVVGCQGSSSAPPAAATPPATAPAAVAPAATALPLTDMTHSFTKDTPYFVSKPTKDTAPDGTFKAGTKVIVLIPGAPYCQVLSQDGVTAYASIENLEPLSNK